jgi:hypothetical protein
MKRIKFVGLALVAVCAMSASMAASAGASSFLSTVASGALTGKLVSLQKFNTKAGQVECSALTVSGSVITTKATIQAATVNYTGCKAFGLAATITPASYEFNANGGVTVVKTITIKATGCTVIVPGGQKLGTVKYANSGSEIELTPNVTGITSEGVGAACTYASESKGTYEGKSKTAVVGGTLKWDA